MRGTLSTPCCWPPPRRATTPARSCRHRPPRLRASRRPRSGRRRSGGGFFLEVARKQRVCVLHHLADAARRLADALLVLDEAKTHVAFTVLAEADARGHGDLGLAQQDLGE